MRLRTSSTAAIAFAFILLAAAAHVKAQTIFYVGDLADNTIRAVDAGGNATVYAKLKTSAQNVYGMAFDATGNLYVALFSSNTVIRIAPNGAQHPFVTAGLSEPSGLAIDSIGDLYIANFGSGTVVKVDTSGNETTVATGLSGPYGLAADSADNVYVSCFTSGGIDEISASGTLSPFANVGAPTELAFDDSDNMYTGDDSGLSASLDQIASDGTVTVLGSGFFPINGVFADSAGNVYFSCTRDGTMFVDSAGTVSVFSTQVALPGFLVGPPPTLSLGLTLAPTAVSGGQKSTGRLTLGAPVTVTTKFALTSADPSVAQVPANVTVFAGNATGSFKITTTPVTSPQNIKITANLNGVNASATLSVNEPSVVHLVLNPTTVLGGVSSFATVTLSGPAPNGGQVVTLSSNRGAAQVQSTVTVLEGTKQAQFTVTTSPVVSQKTATIKASANGTSRSVALTITPPAN